MKLILGLFDKLLTTEITRCRVIKRIGKGNAMMVYGEMKVQLHAFLTLTLHEREWLDSRPGASPLEAIK
jgi:hypothetical protein